MSTVEHRVLSGREEFYLAMRDMEWRGEVERFIDPVVEPANGEDIAAFKLPEPHCHLVQQHEGVTLIVSIPRSVILKKTGNWSDLNSPRFGSFIIRARVLPPVRKRNTSIWSDWMRERAGL